MRVCLQQWQEQKLKEKLYYWRFYTYKYVLTGNFPCFYKGRQNVNTDTKHNTIQNVDTDTKHNTTQTKTL